MIMSEEQFLKLQQAIRDVLDQFTSAALKAEDDADHQVFELSVKFAEEFDQFLSYSEK